MPQTATPRSFPRRPESWYLFCPSRRLDRKPFSRPFLGRRLVGYRTASGRAVVMDANCAHLRADLGRGAVVGEMLRCPFHHWHYGPDGRCARIPSGKAPPASARQRVFPVEERHGYIYVHNGPRPRFLFFPTRTQPISSPRGRFDFWPTARGTCWFPTPSTASIFTRYTTAR